MRISFFPQRRDDTLTLSKQGDVLTINNEPFDFSQLPEGGTLPRDAIDCDYLASEVTRIEGEVHLTLILPHGPNPSQAVAFPEPITVIKDGPITVPQ